MRPIKDLLTEEYWNIGYRTFSDDNTVMLGKKAYDFASLKATKRYWYADPFLFTNKNKLYLFVEMFDNKTGKGIIGCSEYIDNAFTEPYEVLAEDYHLSYPYIFEKDGEIFMMPETHQDMAIQLYKAVDFPRKWEKSKILVNNVDAVDTVFDNDMIIASVICPQQDMSIDLCIYNSDGTACSYNPAYTHSYTKRGAGKCFKHNGKTIRPSQNCEGRCYGNGIIFNEITQCSSDVYSEEEFSRITTENIKGDISKPLTGIHTYARENDIEIVDLKYRRFNFLRLLWIIKNKI